MDLDSFTQSISLPASRVRWLPPTLSDATASHWGFVTGTAASHETGLSLWACSAPNWKQRSAPTMATNTPAPIHALEQMDEGRIWASSKSNFSAKLLATCAAPNHASVQDMQFINERLLLVGSGDGSVSVFSVTSPESDEYSIELTTLFPQVHKYPCTSVSIQPNQKTDPELISAGEDGQIYFHRLNADQVIAALNADNMPISDVLFITSDTFASVSASSQLKIWDKRQLQSPMLLQEYGKRSPFSCCAVHPTRITKLATGTQDGRLTCWDIRNLTEPETMTEQLHTADVWEVMFYPENPDYLVSCSEDGSIGLTHFAEDGIGERSKQFRTIFGNKLSVNSFDVRNNSLIGATDNFSLLFRSL